MEHNENNKSLTNPITHDEHHEKKETSIQPKTPTFAIDYWNNLFDKSLKGFAIGGVTSYILLGRFKVGAFFGLGISAGYFNSDLMKIFNFYLDSYKNNKITQNNSKKENHI